MYARRGAGRGDHESAIRIERSAAAIARAIFTKGVCHDHAAFSDDDDGNDGDDDEDSRGNADHDGDDSYTGGSRDTRSKLPACGSACMTPVRSNCDSVHERPNSTNGKSSAESRVWPNFSSGSPSIQLVASTRSEQNSKNGVGSTSRPLRWSEACAEPCVCSK
eukprot:4622927-Pleurochrysis_carterae.AAC.2